ncbi:hypothetical protein L9F63_023440, partial [Diploptera punctata]
NQQIHNGIGICKNVCCSKRGSMARSGISGSRLHLLHLSATAPSAPLALFFHLDCFRDRSDA